MGATAHLGNGTVINNSVLGFANGKIVLVGDASIVRLNKSAFDTIISAEGMHLYPGLIALNTQLGLNEIEAVRATNDQSETGEMNPSARSIIAYNTDSKVTPTVRSNGILLAEIAPGGARISGQSSVVQLDAWNWEDAMVKSDAGIHLNWPGMQISPSSPGKSQQEQEKKIASEIEKLHNLFADASAYSGINSPDKINLNLEAMRGLFTGSKKLFVHCGYVKEIISAADMCHEFGISMVLVGGEDSWMVTDLLKARNIPVVISNTHKLPSREDEAVDLPYRLPAILHNAGIQIAISEPGFWQVRNLPFQSGTASAYGLTKEEILSAVTRDPAAILGILDTYGTLEEGKSATFFLSSGDIFDMKTNSVQSAWINGRSIDLRNIQTALNRKFRDKYGLK